MAAGDFYFAINATFRFILDNFGREALESYWRNLGKEYYRPLIDRFRNGGLSAAGIYWRDFFEKEPGGEVHVTSEPDRVSIDVRVCPAIRWLKDSNREIVPGFCHHCLHVNRAIAEESGLSFRLEGGGGSCFQVFSRKEKFRP